MSERSLTPDFAQLDVAMDAWSRPFWDAGAEARLVMPKCGACGTFRWPAGPFCPKCRSQAVEWVPPGAASLYSFTVLPVPGAEGEPVRRRVPALAVFADAPGVRLVSVLVDAPLEDVAIDAAIAVDWLPAANAQVPVFRLLP
jgi:uncharacterized OB-fold protein